jgi:hypothetical protein
MPQVGATGIKQLVTNGGESVFQVIGINGASFQPNEFHNDVLWKRVEKHLYEVSDSLTHVLF